MYTCNMYTWDLSSPLGEIGPAGVGHSTWRAPFFNCLLQSTNFMQPETGPVCCFRFCFLDIRIGTIQLKHAGWGAFFGLQPARIILWASTH